MPLDRTRVSLRPLWLAAPLIFITFFLADASRPRPAAGRPAAAILSEEASSRDGRLVVVIVDSLRRSNVAAAPRGSAQGELMPNLHALAGSARARVVDVTTCAANFSLPCMQTLLEGRDSPMAAGLESFSGRPGGGDNLVAAAGRAGLGAALVSDHTLTSLYGRFSRRAFSTESLPPGFLARDLAAIQAAEEYLADPANRVVMLHIPGTDHVTHEHAPGTPEYSHHLGAVDVRLGTFLSHVDTSRDSLAVMGDHGHDDSGHHTRHSLAIFAGPAFDGLFSAIEVPSGPEGRPAVEQKDLLYFLSYPLGLPLPSEYEGRFFAHAPGAVPEESRAGLERYERLQRRTLEAAGLGRGETVRRMDAGWQPDDTDRWRALLGAVPLLSCLLLWIAWCYGRPLHSAPLATIGSGALAAATWWLARGGVAWWALVPGPLGISALVAWRHRTWRALLLLGALLAAAVATSVFEASWAAFFHSRDEFHWGIPLFFVIVLAAGLAAGAIRGWTPSAWPSATQLACLMALPSGAYYYQFNQNLLRSYLIPAAILVVASYVGSGSGRIREHVGSGQSRVHAWVILLLAALLLLPQEAGGWEWHPWIVRPLTAWRPPMVLALYVALAIAALTLLRSLGARLLVGGLLAASPAVAAFFGGPSPMRLVAAEIPIVFGIAWLSTRPAAPAGEDSAEVEGLMLAALGTLVVLSLFDGFAVTHVDFAFALRWTAGIRTELGILVAIAPLIALKYAFPVLALLGGVRVLRGGAAASRIIAWLLLFLVAKLLGLLLQSLAGALASGGKFYELAQVDFLFLAGLAIVVAVWTVLLWLGDVLVAAARKTVVRFTAWPDSPSMPA